MLATELGGLKRHARDAFDFAGGINHRVDGALLAVVECLGDFGLAEIHPAGELAHDKHVDAVALALHFERASVRQLGGQTHRAQIGEQPELLSQRQQRGAFGAFFFGDGGVAVGQTHGAEQNRIARAAQRKRVIRQRLAGGIDARPAHGGLGDFQLKSKFALGRAQHFQRLAHHLRPNSIPR